MMMDNSENSQNNSNNLVINVHQMNELDDNDMTGGHIMVDQTMTTTTNKYMVGSTLEEPIYTTIWRDLSSIIRKCRAVLVPKVFFGTAQSSNGVDHGDGEISQELRDWDLWGPLLFCLILATYVFFIVVLLSLFFCLLRFII